MLFLVDNFYHSYRFLMSLMYMYTILLLGPSIMYNTQIYIVKKQVMHLIVQLRLQLNAQHIDGQKSIPAMNIFAITEESQKKIP